MGKYGYFRYGPGTKYGEVDSNRLYYSSGISAWAYDYNAVSLTWSSVVADPDDALNLPTHWRLTRNYGGEADSPFTGDVLDSDIIETYRLSYLDNSINLLGNIEATYTLWVFNGVRWINTGSVSVQVIDETTTADTVKDRMPAAWLNATFGIGDATGEVEDLALSKVIDAYVFEYDKLKTQAALLEDSTDGDLIPASLLKNKVLELGFTYEPSLGDVYHRSLYKAGHTINANKGTTRGVIAYTTALTHWPCEIEPGNNLMLDYNDSSFEESIGRWSITGGTLARQVYQTATADLGVSVSIAVPKLYNTAYPPRAIACGLVTTSGTSTVLTLGVSNPIGYGIPVSSGTRYIFRGLVRQVSATTANVTVTISWFTSSGTLISTTTPNTALTTSTSWQEVLSGSDSAQNGFVAPNNATYAGITITLASSSAKKFLFDMLSFKVSDDATMGTETTVPGYEYQDARLTEILIESDIENVIPNPEFENGTAFWEGYNGSLSVEEAPPVNSHVMGTKCGKLVSTIAGTTAIVSDWMTLYPGTPYSFSMYISGAVGRKAKTRIEYSSPLTLDDQVKVLLDETSGNFYYDPTVYYVDSEEFTVSATTERIFVSLNSPEYTPDYGDPMGKVSVYFTDAQVGDSFYLDGALLTPTPDQKDYFSGSGGIFPEDPNTSLFFDVTDCRWERREQINFVSNPTLETTTKWTAGAGTTLTSSTDYALFGSKSGKVSKSGGGSLSTTVYLPRGAAIGGEDIVVSAYVRNKAGTYTLSTNGQAAYSYAVAESAKDVWTRLYVQRVTEIGETSFTFTISLDTGSASAAVFYVDGVQAEYGRVPTPFVDPAAVGVTTDVNAAINTESVYYGYGNLTHSSVSYWSNRYAAKLARLEGTISKYLPLGSSHAFGTPPTPVGFTDLQTSLLPSGSFEANLRGWNASSSTLKRVISRGSIFDELLTHGAAYAKVSASVSGNFGVVSDKIAISPGTGYFVTAALKPETEDAYGTYKLKLNWYNAANEYLYSKENTLNIQTNDYWTHFQIVAPGSKTISVSALSVTGGVGTATTVSPHGFSTGEIITFGSIAGDSGVFPAVLSGFTVTITSTTTTTISFDTDLPDAAEVEVTTKAVFISTSMAYATVEVVATPDFPGVGRTFHLDKVVFRE